MALSYSFVYWCAPGQRKCGERMEEAEQATFHQTTLVSIGEVSQYSVIVIKKIRVV